MSGAFALRTNELLALGGPADDVVNEVEAEAGGSPSTERMLALLSNSSAGYGGAGSA